MSFLLHWPLTNDTREEEHQVQLCADETLIVEVEQFVAWAEGGLAKSPGDVVEACQKMGDMIYKWTAHWPEINFIDCWVS